MILAESGMGNLIIPVRILTIVVEIIWLIHIISKFRMEVGSHLSAYSPEPPVSASCGHHRTTPEYLQRFIYHRSFERIGNTGLAYRSPFGGNEQYTVGGFRSVKVTAGRHFFRTAISLISSVRYSITANIPLRRLWQSQSHRLPTHHKETRLLQ